MFRSVGPGAWGWLLLPVLAGACDDTEFGSGGGEAVTEGCDLTADYCGVRDLFEAECVSCHGSESPSAGLDLSSDFIAATVGVESALYPDAILVQAGDAEGSLLYRKSTATQTSGEGGSMPPGSRVGDYSGWVLQTWIENGAEEDCTDTGEPADTDSPRGGP